MPRFVAWGCNITGSLDPDVAEHILTRPTDITEDQIHEIIWVGWAATVGRTARGIRVWGSSNILDDAKVKDFDIGPVKRILGFDTIRGWLDELGHVHDFRGRQTTTTWDDMTISGHGTVYALTRTHGLVIFRSMDHLFSDGEPVRVIHPILSPIHPAKMYSMESRAFLHSLGPMQQLFEIVTTDNKGKPCEPSLTLIEDLEGMGMEIVPGSCNRLGIITDAGEAYVLGQRSREVDPLDVGDARLLGLGSDFDVVVIDHKVLTKGDSAWTIKSS